MKDIPIVILNKDRLIPLKNLVLSLKNKEYNNIIIIDNQSTYKPLLNWYKDSGVDVFYNNINETLFDSGTLYRLIYEIKHPKFIDINKSHYIYTDSDVVPIEEIPVNFVEDMIEVCDEFKAHKVGLGLKIDDLPDFEYSKYVIEKEHGFWNNKIPHNKYELYQAGIDTTFAVYYPNTAPLLDSSVIRMGNPYVARHLPWYYDINNLPEDEFHYIKNLDPNKACYSRVVKNIINI